MWEEVPRGGVCSHATTSVAPREGLGDRGALGMYAVRHEGPRLPPSNVIP